MVDRSPAAQLPVRRPDVLGDQARQEDAACCATSPTRRTRSSSGTSCDLIGGPKSWWLGGSLTDGKGEPSQINAVSHGCPPARFRKVNILNTNRRTRRDHADATRSQRLVDRILALVHATKGADAIVGGRAASRDGNTRFARQRDHDVGRRRARCRSRSPCSSASARRRRRRTSSTTASIDDWSARALRMARLAPENPEADAAARRARRYVAVEERRRSRRPPARRRDVRAKAVGAAIAAADAAKVAIAGFFEPRAATARARRPAPGCRRYHAWTSCGLSCTARTADGTGSGWAGAAANRVADLDAARAREDRGRQGDRVGEAAASSIPAATPSSSSRRRSPSLLGVPDRRARRAPRRRGPLVLQQAAAAAATSCSPRRSRCARDPTDAGARRRAVRRRGLPARADRVDRQGRAHRRSPYTRYWAQEAGQAADRLAERLARSTAARAHARRADQGRQARRPDHAVLVPALARSADASSRPGSRATACS